VTAHLGDPDPHLDLLITVLGGIRNREQRVAWLT